VFWIVSHFSTKELIPQGSIDEAQLRTKGQQTFMVKNKIEPERDYEYKYLQQGNQVTPNGK
jgi:hypothetical protein